MLIRNSEGQSVIEVIVAIAIFVILAGGAVLTILGSFLTSRQGEEETRAAFLAQEGIYASESIRNQSWSGLVDGPHGLLNNSGTWQFSGANQIIGKFTRVLSVSSVQRNLAGDIVTSGGVVDPNTKRINSQINWNFTPNQLTTVEMTTYFTNWQSANPFPIPSPTPLPPTTSCNQVCLNNGYTGSNCRANATACTTNNQINLSTGNVFCTGGAASDTCCCTP